MFSTTMIAAVVQPSTTCQRGAAIRALLDLSGRPDADCTAAHTLALTQIEDIDERMRQLAALRSELVRMATTCAGGVIGECRIIETLVDFGHGRCADATHGTDR